VSPTEHVLLRLGGSRYALPADVVTRLVPPMVLSRLPGVPSWVAGLGDLRGRVVPVLDLRPLLGAAPAPWPSSSRVLACALPDGDRRPVEVGLLADQVLGLLPVAESDVRSLPSGLDGRPDGLLRGLLTTTPPVALLDPAGLLALRGRLGPG
jgi:chemotaxis signal transduction protein